MGRPDRPTRGRACEPCGLEFSTLGSTIRLISRQSASRMPPMGRPDRPTRGRACEPCGLEFSTLGSTIRLISRQSASRMPPMGRPDRPTRGRACDPCGLDSAASIRQRRSPSAASPDRAVSSRTALEYRRKATSTRPLSTSQSSTSRTVFIKGPGSGRANRPPDPILCVATGRT